jgi:hypothetical protein
VVYAAAVFEHLACPLRAAQEVFRVLKPGGAFLANVSFLEPWHDDSYFHATPLGVIEWLTRSGFEAERVWPGRGWTVFQSVPSMAFLGPFRLLRHGAAVMNGAYRAQRSLRNLRRRLTGGPAHDKARHDAVIAGAINWKARRPATSTTP